MKIVGYQIMKRYLSKAKRIIRQQGLAGLFRKTVSIMTRSRQYRKFFLLHAATPDQLDRQRMTRFSYFPKISILVPLFNTPEVFLRELLESVTSQTYTNWQICFADGSQHQSDLFESIVKNFACADKRILYIKLEGNRGISGNTNACLDLADGEYIALLDHDDLLAPNALFEVVSAINETGADFLYTDEQSFENTPDRVNHIHFKPDFAIDNLRSNNYICHFTVFSKALIEKVGRFDSRFDGSQDYDIILRLTEQAAKVHHIAMVLYYWRVHGASVASDISAKPYAITAAKKAVQSHLDRIGIKGTVTDSYLLSTYKINYDLNDHPLITILILNLDSSTCIKRCVDSIIKKSTYDNYEIIIIDIGSGLSQSIVYEALLEQYDFLSVSYHSDVNALAEILNTLANRLTSDYLVFLDNNLEIRTPGWIEEMLMFAQRSDVAAVGSKIYFRNQTIQHAGIGIGLLSTFGYYHRGLDQNDPGYASRLTYAQDVSAVSGSCFMTSLTKFRSIGGFDKRYRQSLFDVDYCLKARNAGYLVVFTPYSELVNFEYSSRMVLKKLSKKDTDDEDMQTFKQKWENIIENGDPYYNRNLSLSNERFTVKRPNHR